MENYVIAEFEIVTIAANDNLTKSTVIDLGENELPIDSPSASSSVITA